MGYHAGSDSAGVGIGIAGTGALFGVIGARTTVVIDDAATALRGKADIVRAVRVAAERLIVTLKSTTPAAVAEPFVGCVLLTFAAPLATWDRQVIRGGAPLAAFTAAATEAFDTGNRRTT